MDLGIVIPCYNESKRLRNLEYEAFLKLNQKTIFCFVNDGSKDTTLQILKDIQVKNPNKVHVINKKINNGKARAVKVGMNYLYKLKNCDKIAFLDADLSAPLNECFNLAKIVDKKTKMVFASRIKKLDNVIQRKWYRFFTGRVIATFISRILNLPIYDTQCGCKIFTPEMIPIVFKKNFISRWLFDVEIFFRIKNHFGETEMIKICKEVPIKVWADKGNSKIKLSYSFYVWLDLLKIYIYYK